MVGDGPLYKKIFGLVRSSGLSRNYIFTGRIPYERVPAYISLSNFCVAPYSSKYETYSEYSPLKLYSYLSCAKPVVSTDIGGVSDLIRTSGAGAIVKADDPASMAGGILKLLEDTRSQTVMGKKARNYILKNCTWRQTAKKVLAECRRARDVRQAD
jgi:glycosyltransferase involved in cell wall biosynthesis